jgi:hypothetical protein
MSLNQLLETLLAYSAAWIVLFAVILVGDQLSSLFYRGKHEADQSLPVSLLLVATISTIMWNLKKTLWNRMFTGEESLLLLFSLSIFGVLIFAYDSVTSVVQAERAHDTPARSLMKIPDSTLGR